MSERVPETQRGFTLVEALVAMAILAIAAIGIVRAAEAHIVRLESLERRAAAQMVAENALTEMRLRIPDSMANTQEPVTMMQWRWRVETSVSRSEDPDIDLATVRVFQEDEDDPLVTMRGFVDRGTITR